MYSTIMEGQTGKRRFFKTSTSSVRPRNHNPRRNFQPKLSKTTHNQSLSLDELIKISNEESDVIIHNILKEMPAFISMVENEAIDHIFMTHILIILGKVTTSKLQSEVNSIMSSLSKCKMFYSIHIPQYLASFHQPGLGDKDFKSLEMLTELLIMFHHCMPCTAIETTSVLFPLLENTVKVLLPQDKNLSLLLEKIVETNMRNKEFQQSIKPKDVRYKSAKERLQLQKPPENYRTLPILPTPDDIHRSCSFLRPNLIKGQYMDADHYLDVQFRLLREDYIRPLRDGISEYLRLKEKNEPFSSVQDAIVHSKVYITNIVFNEENIIHTACFKDKSFTDINWKQSKRFINGSLLCFSSNDFKTFFLATVVERKEEQISKGILSLQFESPTLEVLNFSPSRRFVVIETSAYFEAYKHNLTVLSLLNEKMLPMQPYIIKVKKDVDMPAYIRHDDFFDILPLFKKDIESHSVEKDTDDYYNHYLDYDLKVREPYIKCKNIHILNDDDWPNHSDLNLDSFQLAAIKAALTNEFCIIQGPPGTGKTFVGLKIVEILLLNKLKWQTKENSCPILVVCYTNHALDQFLEGLLDFTKNIVRIGGSCSNSKLDHVNLKILRKGCKDCGEKSKIIEKLKNDIIFKENSIEKSYSEILNEKYFQHIIHFRQFQSFNRKTNSSNVMSDWLNHRKKNQNWKQYQNSIKDILDSTMALSENDAKKVLYLWDVPLKRRWSLYKLWLTKYLSETKNELVRLKAQLKKQLEEFQKLQMKVDEDLCRKANIIGMTTTGAAKNRYLLQHASPKIVVVEEAAEILESHIVTSLSSGTEHVILIGDHQQLRPNSTVYSLAVDYDLNISLFERMINNGIKYNKLNLQHRMRPDIASLLVPHFYEDLQNHDSVEKFEDIEEMAKNMFFVTHNHHETRNDSKSKINIYEAKFIVRLYMYLILQGYASSQITILTTYTGQMFAIQNELKKIRAFLRCKEDDVRVTVVDNYQGEENEIILISFVRSNVEGKIGFLKISNRVCVALSRAKKGFYGIGNFESLANESDLWKKISDKLKEQDAIGPSLQLKCQNHPETSVVITDEKDFDSVPEGGCSIDCNFRMDCGHQCSLKCHPYDGNHEKIICLKPCNKHCIRGHLCSRKCCEKCGDCFVMVNKVIDLCGHETKVFCYRAEKEAVCPQLCPKFFSCLYNGLNVKGVLDNVFFIPCSSGVNSNVNFMEKFSEYLGKQGYKCPSILPTRRKEPSSNRKKDLPSDKQENDNDLLLAVFDEFSEGNEFLKTSTEIFLTLSGAKRGIFCIGDFEMFAEKFDFWKDIICALRREGKIGPSLRLQCQNHPETCEMISKDEDFNLVKEGGCTKLCEFKLHCGHVCPLKCHPYDMEHKKVVCLEPCMRKCDFGHLCKKKCCEKCECSEMVDKKLESCGHIEKVKCHLRNKPIDCLQVCERYLSSAHKCTDQCKKTCKTSNCVESIIVNLPDCNHECVIECWMKSVITHFCDLCETPCNATLSCGHVCKGTCKSCNQGRLHIPCKKRCQRVLICGHKCPAFCFESCPPCEVPCENKCKHKVCPKLCGEPCDPCLRRCEWKCPHKKCNNL